MGGGTKYAGDCLQAEQHDDSRRPRMLGRSEDDKQHGSGSNHLESPRPNTLISYSSAVPWAYWIDK